MRLIAIKKMYCLTALILTQSIFFHRIYYCYVDYKPFMRKTDTEEVGRRTKADDQAAIFYKLVVRTHSVQSCSSHIAL